MNTEYLIALAIKVIGGAIILLLLAAATIYIIKEIIKFAVKFFLETLFPLLKFGVVVVGITLIIAVGLKITGNGDSINLIDLIKNAPLMVGALVLGILAVPVGFWFLGAMASAMASTSSSPAPEPTEEDEGDNISGDARHWSDGKLRSMGNLEVHYWGDGTIKSIGGMDAQHWSDGTLKSIGNLEVRHWSDGTIRSIGGREVHYWSDGTIKYIE
jgi:hypothetical protein